MKEKESVRISQCMIVKNEEANIEQALSWGKGIVWEQIVVDTGSTDRTVELAERMGAKVYHFPWIDDFAAAKNFALDKAEGEWIAFLDADETFVKGDEEKLYLLLQELDARNENWVEGIFTDLMNVSESGEITAVSSQMRIFRNRSGLRYRGRVHEDLVWEDGHTFQFGDATGFIAILHTGYQKKVQERQNKTFRNYKLILKELEECPDDYEMMGYLGDDCMSRNEQKEAAYWYQKAIDAMPEVSNIVDQRRALTFIGLMKILIKSDEKDAGTRIEELYRKATESMPEEPDFDYLYACFLVKQERYQEVKVCLERALKKLEQFSGYNRGMYTEGNLKSIYEDLALLCLKEGEPKRTVELCVSVLKTDPDSMRALTLLLRAFRGTERNASVTPRQAADVLRKLLDFTSVQGRYLSFCAARQIDWKEMAEYMETQFSEEEKKLMKERGMM